jgi:hypothetical protein
VVRLSWGVNEVAIDMSSFIRVPNQRNRVIPDKALLHFPPAYCHLPTTLDFATRLWRCIRCRLACDESVSRLIRPCRRPSPLEIRDG